MIVRQRSEGMQRKVIASEHARFLYSTAPMPVKLYGSNEKSYSTLNSEPQQAARTRRRMVSRETP